MKATLIAALAGSALLSSAASAAPLSNGGVVTENMAEQVRLVCNESGRCWRSRGPRYVVRDYDYGYRRSYGYYGGGPGYYGGHGYYGGGPSIGFSFGTRGW